MNMRVLKETKDRRGKIIWLASDGKEIHVVETKNGFSRGGHYHPYDSTHVLVSGQLIYRECGMKGEKEINKTVRTGATIFTAANRAHMITAVQDSVFIEIFESPYKATDFLQYRKIVNDALRD